MDKIICDTKIQAAKNPDGLIAVRTIPVHGSGMLHFLTEKEWVIIEVFLDALTNPPSPVPYILHELGGYMEEEEAENYYE